MTRFVTRTVLASALVHAAAGQLSGAAGGTSSVAAPPAGAAPAQPAAPAVVLEPGMVDCGGSIAKSCQECPAGHGETWCHGSCDWVTDFGVTKEKGMCMPKVVIPGLSPEKSPLGAGFYYWGVSAASSFVFLTAVAFIYYVRIVAGPPELPQTSMKNATPARRHIFDCFKHRDTCLYTTFFLPIVAAKNAYIAGVLPYWAGFFVYFFLVCGPWAAWGFWPGLFGGFTLAAVVRVCLSIQVQKKLGFSPNIVKTVVYNTFCMPCDIGRESLEADAEIGADITCCFKVWFTPSAFQDVENLVEHAAERSCISKTRLCGGH